MFNTSRPFTQKHNWNVLCSNSNQELEESRPKLVEPIEYETFVVKNKVLLHNDPQRDMLCFPHDDVLVPPPAPPRKIRTAESTVPVGAEEKATSLMVKECLKTYTSDLQTVKFKYQAYGGSYQQLPNADKKEPLQEHVFEIDAEVEEKDDDTLSRGFVSAFAKKGWLLKGPDSGKDNVISFTRQFKRRFFILKQQSDYTHILEIHKDDKKLDAKGAIFLDLAQEVVRNPKKGKHCFEIRMQDRPPCLLAAESEAEASDWISTLNKVINAADTASQISRDSIREENPSTGTPENYKESSINHPVVKDLSSGSNGTAGDSSSDSVTSGEDLLPPHQSTPHPQRARPRRPPPPPPPLPPPSSHVSYPSTKQEQHQQQQQTPPPLPPRPASFNTSIPSSGQASLYPKIAVTAPSFDNEFDDSSTSDTTPDQATPPDPTESEFKRPLGIPDVIMRKKKVADLGFERLAIFFCFPERLIL
ncbi:dedicator of cytokinesis protein 9 [Elysia marginata]|uniref:Dedicator of cytokinesis protein 9 n=1 Tax=Elysia marginata TaxID=1093978 RepID=A0AAV4J4D4_9GAST|nr:dedicator of cytokinesis protein 9 [Elysia marginata]